MGVSIPGVTGLLHQPTGQVIDGSLGFDESKQQYLEITPSSVGNRRTWTWSGWVKIHSVTQQTIFSAAVDGSNRVWLRFNNEILEFQLEEGGAQTNLYTNAVYRDTSAWYHIVVAVDTTQATSSDRSKIYINGEQVTSFSAEQYPTQNYDTYVNATNIHRIGSASWSVAVEADSNMTQCYIIDGQALGPEYFGFTDPLTNTWRPKKYEGTFGTNSFYLPMDGNSPIGQDKSGNGNDWTPVNFGGSNSLEKATGALPILNTVSGGKVATAGVRTDAYASSLVLALPLVGNKEDVVASINSAQTNVTVTNNGSVPFQSTQSNFYGGSAFFEDSSSDNLTFTNFGSRFEFTGDYTIEAWIYPTDSGAADGSIFVENSGSNYFAFNFDPGTQFTIYNNSSSPSWTPSTNLPPANKWSHIALVRSGSTQTIYVNGNSIATNTASGTHGYASPSFARIGGGAASGLDSYIQDLRVYKGVAKYTSNFIPASTNPDILPDTPSGVSGGSKLTKITDGAVSFDGSGDYLELADNTDLELGSGDFTIEGYYYFKNTGSFGTNFWGKWASTPGRSYAFSYVKSSGKYIFAYSTNGTDETFAEVVSPADIDRWVHFAAVRNGTSLKVYRDGKEIITHNIGTTTIYNSSANLMIGRLESNSNYDMNGFVSNFRLIKGTALYTANFTPPTAPLTNVTNTKLLCCQSNVYVGTAVTSPNMGGVNDGTQWSNGGVGDSNWDSSFPIQRGFNGEAAYGTGNVNMARPNNANVTATWNAPGSGIPFSTLKLTAARDSGSYSNAIKINGVDVTSQFTASTSTLETVTITGVTSPLTKLELTAQSGVAQPRFTAIYIDDVILTDPVTFEGNAAATNFNPFNTDINTVRGQESGYATLNPLFKSSNITLSEGNLKAFNSGTGAWVNSTFAINSGKWYWEVLDITDGIQLGISEPSETGLPGNRSTFYGDPGTGVNVLLGVALDLDNLTVDWYIDGILTSSVSINAGTYTPVYGSNNSSKSAVFNFGQKPFKFPPPDGYQPLNAANVRPETVIARPDQYVGVTTYSGDNTDPRQINLGMAPDLIWVKTRNQANWNWLTDTVRGAPNKLYSNDTSVDDTAPIYGQADSLNDFGFVAGGGTDGSDPLSDSNKTGTDYVVWSWKAGGNKNTFNVDDVGYASAAAAGLTGGDITPTGASVGTKQGFSIIKYDGSGTAGDDFPHGLSQEPDFVIVKQTSSSTTNKNWCVYHRSLGGTKVTLLNSNAASATTADTWNDTDPTSTLITLGAGDDAYATQTNVSSKNYICYAWHDVPGLQKFGKYAGNGSDDGPFVELGFRPKLIIAKASTNAGVADDWLIWDSERDLTNPTDKNLSANYAGVEQYYTGGLLRPTEIDFLSNGFKIRNTRDASNKDGDTYIYAAWAEAPASNLFGGQPNAR